MENQDISNPLFDLSINDKVKQSIRSAAVFGGITAILVLVKVALNVFGFFIVKDAIPKPTEGFQDSNISIAVTGFIGLAIGILISVLLFYFLNKFARNAKAGVDTNNPQLITEGLGGLAAYFRFIGVLIILLITLMILVYMAFSFGSSVI